MRKSLDEKYFPDDQNATPIQHQKSAYTVSQEAVFLELGAVVYRSGYRVSSRARAYCP